MTQSTTGNRTYSLKMPDGWEPPYPSFMSEFDDNRTTVVMCLMGCQYDEGHRPDALALVQQLRALMLEFGQAAYVDLSECEADSAGRRQLVATGYWFEPEPLRRLFESEGFTQTWGAHTQADLPYGVFREVFNFPMSRFETLHSGPDHLVGIANVRDGITEPIPRHAYWGSMRDRIPDAAIDRFEANERVQVLDQDAHSVTIRPNVNLAIIRSGQDITDAVDEERAQYSNDVEPTLVNGMNFLRDEGEEVKCYDCRFFRFVDEHGEPSDHTYGYAYFQSLEELEKWAEHHPSHNAIFGSFLEFAPKYGEDMRSRFWHEVAVLPADDQFAQYVNCAEGTGLLGGLNPR
ncbi:MAG: phenylacetaldoxime dehydratase family protein [Lysobacterales bacterium]